MGFSVKFLKNCTYTKQNQIVFNETTTGKATFTDEYTVAGRFSPHIASIRVPQSILVESPAEVCACVIKDNDDVKAFDFWYFINGYQRLTATAIEFYLEPDNFHTYFFKDEKNTAKISGLLEQTTAAKAKWKKTFPESSEGKILNACVISAAKPKQIAPKTTTLVSNKYRVVLLVAASEQGAYTFSLCGANSFTRENALKELSQLSNKLWTNLYYYDSTVSNSWIDYGAFKYLRGFIIPETLLNFTFSTLSKYKLSDSASGTGWQMLGLPSSESVVNFTNTYFEETVEKFACVGTRITKIKLDGYIGTKSPRVMCSFGAGTVAIIFQAGNKTENITNDFEFEISQNLSETNLAQHKTTDAISKTSAVFNGLFQSFMGAVQLSSGNVIGGAAAIASGIANPVSIFAASEENKNLTFGVAGVNLGFYNILGDEYGFGIDTYESEDDDEVHGLNQTFGYSVGAWSNELYINASKSLFDNDFIKFKQCEIKGLRLPAAAKSELENLFTNGIFIRKYNSSDYS